MIAITLEEVRARLQAAVDTVGTRKEWAELHDISPSYVTEVLNGIRPPGDKILRALGLTRRLVYGTEDRQEDA